MLRLASSMPLERIPGHSEFYRDVPPSLQLCRYLSPRYGGV